MSPRNKVARNALGAYSYGLGECGSVSASRDILSKLHQPLCVSFQRVWLWLGNFFGFRFRFHLRCSDDPFCFAVQFASLEAARVLDFQAGKVCAATAPEFQQVSNAGA